MTEFQEELCSPFEREVLRLLRHIAVRQETIHMADETQLQQLGDAVSAVEAEETQLEADETAEVAYLQNVQAQLTAAGSPIDLSPIIAREQALLAKLTTDDTTLAGEVPAPAPTPTPEPTPAPDAPTS